MRIKQAKHGFITAPDVQPSIFFTFVEQEK